MVTFNLGYLPGGNKELITKPETTLSALIQAYDYLTKDGIISLIVYRGHPEDNMNMINWKNDEGKELGF